MARYDILLSPTISEKTTTQAALRKYTFKVKNNATKNEIKKAVEEKFKVKVESVNIINTKSKKRRRGRIVGKKSGFRKAIVTLKKGQKIEILE